MELIIPPTTNDVIGPLPEGWSRATIGEISVVNPRSFEREPDAEDRVSFLPMQAIHEGDGHLDLNEERPWREVNRGYTRFQEGDVIFAKITPCMENGKVSVAHGLKGGRAAGTTELHVFRPRTGIHPDFVRYFLLTDKVRRNARARMTGTAGQLRVPAAVMEQMEIPVPPTAEQKRIVAAIETRFARLDAAVKSLERARANLKRYRASVVRAAADGSLTGCKSDWESRGLLDVAEDLDGKRVPVNAKERERRVGTVPYYGATGQVGWIDDYLFDEELILLGEDGVDFLNPLKPKAYAIRGKSWVNNHAHVLRARPDMIDRRYLLIQLNATNYFGLANGTTRLKLTKSAMSRISIPLPPIHEQLAIVSEVERRISVADEAGLEIESGLRRAARLREAILNSAFEGRLASQDPNDEPANSLLERIKTTKQLAPNPIRRGQKLLAAE